MEKTVRIVDYSPSFQPAIDRMMEDIQAEFEELITSPQSTRIWEVYQLKNQHFWVALSGDQVVGTIGIVLYSRQNVVLKRMMVHPAFRGRAWNTAKLLLDEALNWASLQEAKRIYLGTMGQFVAAQKFYEKEGFHHIDQDELPSDYVSNPIDTVFYSREI